MMTARRRSSLLALAAACVLALAGTTAPAQGTSTTIAPVGGDFLWGVASSGFQSEGDAPDSNRSRRVEQGHTADPYLNSVDFGGRYRSDIALAARLGVKVYRIGIEWARVQPEPDRWDEDALRFYDDVVASIMAAGMRPMITLDHWVYPGWQLDRGGWSDPGMVAAWLANARRVVDRYAHADPLWVSFNEPLVYQVREVTEGRLAAAEAPAMHDRIAQAHNAIYDHIHAVQPDAMVTSNVSYIPTVEDLANKALLDKFGGRLDYVGIDYYYGLSPAALTEPWSVDELWRNPLHAEGIYYALRHYARAFPGKPLYIVENGMPTENGRPRADGYSRADHLRDTVYWLQRAITDGIPVMGYNYWSLTDNYEWGSYTPRFGLYTVDVLTDPGLTRTPTDAVEAYRAITRAGGVPADYRPTREPALCSLVDGAASCLEPVTITTGT
ncbi:family 1 glycosylhydrolase [Nocardia farcinica]|uniref:family 1 glycosylhydrolase n=1 Tax=Nocardia farcinica TaxID=37329 RepID=UPI002457C610|nr:family 1 glycosylhydrolase [Nocardia farcinica]